MPILLLFLKMNVKKAFSRPSYVLDASVIIKLIVREAGDSDIMEHAVFRLGEHIQRGDITLSTSSLAYFEVGNWAARAFPHEALAIMSSLLLFDIKEHVVNVEIVATACEIIRECSKVTFYDASYHAMALEDDSIFLTNDKAYYLQAKHKGHIQLLERY